MKAPIILRSDSVCYWTRVYLIRLGTRITNMSLAADPEFGKVNIRTLGATIIIKSLNYDPSRNACTINISGMPSSTSMHTVYLR